MRKQGYYWIKFDKKSDWEIAEYIPQTDRFKYTNGSFSSANDVHEIDEGQIERGLKEGDKVLIDDEIKGEIENITPLYFIKEKNGDINCYAELNPYTVFEVNDIGSIEKTK